MLFLSWTDKKVAWKKCTESLFADLTIATITKSSLSEEIILLTWGKWFWNKLTFKWIYALAYFVFPKNSLLQIYLYHKLTAERPSQVRRHFFAKILESLYFGSLYFGAFPIILGNSPLKSPVKICLWWLLMSDLLHFIWEINWNLFPLKLFTKNYSWTF